VSLAKKKGPNKQVQTTVQKKRRNEESWTHSGSHQSGTDQIGSGRAKISREEEISFKKKSQKRGGGQDARADEKRNIGLQGE